MESAESWQIPPQRPGIIGILEGMFEGNIITFDPGDDQIAPSSPTDSGTDG